MNIYFDNAATSSPKPPEVLERVSAALTEFNANPGRSGHSVALSAAREVLSAREKLASLMNAGEETNIAFAFNCTDALNLAIKGALRYGDHVITTQLEHNSVLRPINALAARGRISLSIVSPRADGFVDPEDIRASIRKNTRLIAVTHASNVTGAIQPVAAIGELARREGILYLIDGAQAIGATPVNVRALSCDLYAFPGHKSLLGPMGTGGLYIRPGVVLRTLREGGTGTDSESMLQPDERPERYESGTLNLPGIAGLGAGCAFVAKRVSAIMSHERELTGALYEGLSAIRGAEIYSPREEAARAGIVSFNLPGMTSSDVADRLGRMGIAVRGGLHCAPGAHRFLGTLRRGAVRASVGYANTFEEVDAFLNAVNAIVREG